MIREFIWNPWHGCRKYSEGCRNCYVYRRDSSVGRDASQITQNADFDLPVRTDRKGKPKIPSGSSVYVCMTSDFFLDDPAVAPWREQAWQMIRQRTDVHFTVITKRIVHFAAFAPSDWKDGYENVSICCTMENQAAFDRRMPCFLELPIRHKFVVCEPLLGPIDFADSLGKGIIKVVAGGESGDNARPCRFDWILDIRQQCIRAGTAFYFKQTGARFVKDGVLYRVPRKLQHSQAQKAGINTAADFRAFQPAFSADGDENQQQHL